mgnify:CR=1 FL=1
MCESRRRRTAGGKFHVVEASVRINCGPFVLGAALEWGNAPRTCAAFMRMLPLQARLIQTRWSGEAAWVPLGDVQLGLGFENPTSYPAAGELLLYPGGGLSEVEILVAYGATRFASKAGQLAGNHFATIVQGREQLAEIGRLVLFKGAQDIRFDLG